MFVAGSAGILRNGLSASAGGILLSHWPVIVTLSFLAKILIFRYAIILTHKSRFVNGLSCCFQNDIAKLCFSLPFRSYRRKMRRDNSQPKRPDTCSLRYCKRRQRPLCVRFRISQPELRMLAANRLTAGNIHGILKPKASAVRVRNQQIRSGADDTEAIPEGYTKDITVY